MNDEDIKKALECCIEMHCTECPIAKEFLCMQKLREHALDLINRQQAEIEWLQKKYDRAMDNLKAVLKERAGEQDV